jgi:hypothetical protein
MGLFVFPLAGAMTPVPGWLQSGRKPSWNRGEEEGCACGTSNQMSRSVVHLWQFAALFCRAQAFSDAVLLQEQICKLGSGEFLPSEYATFKIWKRAIRRILNTRQSARIDQVDSATTFISIVQIN